MFSFATNFLPTKIRDHARVNSAAKTPAFGTDAIRHRVQPSVDLDGVHDIASNRRPNCDLAGFYYRVP